MERLSGRGFHGGRHVAAQVNTDDVSTWRRTVVYERPNWDPSDLAPQPLVQYSVWVADESFGKHAGYARVTVQAGPRGCERRVPPAGEDHAYDVPLWARRVEVTVSPKGRSARVWVDGVEIPTRKDGDGG
jgi:hypothetical protein